MNNSATTRRISKIAIQYNGDDLGKAQLVGLNLLLGDDAEQQFKEIKIVKQRNRKIKQWALTGYISPEKNIGDSLTNEELADITIQSLRKIGVTELNQYRLDIHNSTKQKHIYFVANRVDINGKCTVKAHDIGKRFGEAVRSVCKEKGIKTDVEITAEKKEKMLNDLQLVLNTARNFVELENKMRELGYWLKLSQNSKVGISGMRIARIEDLNPNTKRVYEPGYKLSELTNKLKIKHIKQILNENERRKVTIRRVR
ncbi:relaxase/mobilization nuclease domain-containing protein [Ornithobacterium rhinotracheale]|uniref:relaxase/mobilization nuclease domain-containing protein n=1 Tax=Ornithobacterium rhinotracheale TaxID=28251 RepID=UPI0040361D6A